MPLALLEARDPFVRQHLFTLLHSILPVFVDAVLPRPRYPVHLYTDVGRKKTDSRTKRRGLDTAEVGGQGSGVGFKPGS